MNDQLDNIDFVCQLLTRLMAMREIAIHHKDKDFVAFSVEMINACHSYLAVRGMVAVETPIIEDGENVGMTLTVMNGVYPF